jgi:clan AA aspartic protease
MGKVIEKIRLTNFLDPTHTAEVEALIDTGASTIALPLDMVLRLGLKKLREVRVRYANGTSESKGIYGVVAVEIKGRAGEFDVIAEAEGTQPLVGQIVLEQLDLVVDPRNRCLMPNPASPDMPLLELL